MTQHFILNVKMECQNSIIFEKAKPDGLTVQYGPVFAFNQIISAPGVRFKIEKFTFIGGAVSAPRIMVMRKDAVPGGAKKSADIMKATSLKLVAVRPTVILSLYSRPALDMLGIKYRHIPGHRGGGKVRAAVQSGFGNIATHGLSGYRARSNKRRSRTARRCHFGITHPRTSRDSL